MCLLFDVGGIYIFIYLEIFSHETKLSCSFVVVVVFTYTQCIRCSVITIEHYFLS